MRLFSALFATLFLASCNHLSQQTKETINKGGEVVGKTATEFVEGVSDGIDKTLQCEVNLTPALEEKGLKKGVFSLGDSLGGKHNTLVIYLIFEKDFSGSLSAKAFNQDSFEIGRQTLAVSKKAGEAGYFDFVFDKRTNIESKSKITIE